MNCVLHSYPLYKHSGVSWLGTVPEHWSVRRIKTLFRELDERSGDGQGELLSLTRSNGLVPHWQASNRIASVDDLSNYKVCRSGALVMNRMQAWSGMFAVASQDGLISPDYCVFGPVGSCVVKYFEHLFKTPLVVSQFARQSKGIGSGFNRLYTDDFGSIPVLVPPLPEQRAIVRYLDHADRRIQHYITAKRKLIALLEEEKQAVVNQAVTRGLDPNVRLKPSGVEWLGDVPEHWEIRRAKFFYREADEQSATGAEKLMSVSHITGVTPRKKSVTMFLAESNIGYKLCRPGDIVINTMWAFMAALGVARQNGLVSPSYGVYRPLNTERLNHNYIDSLLRTEAYRTNYLIRSTGITSSRLRLYAESFLGIPLLCPPNIEQNAIVEYLERATAATNAAITRARRQIELVQEYRTRLIADMVTGKLDVREAAARLPDEADHQGPVEEGGPLGDDMVGEGGLQDKELRCHSHGVSLRAGGQ